jgi:hypothetical protein
MIKIPNCAKRLNEHLEELKRKEDLERLREPLIEHQLFPHGRDPNLSGERVVSGWGILVPFT